MQCFMCMPATLSPPWDIVKIINTLNFERYMPTAFNESQITTRIAYFRQIYNFTTIDVHIFFRILTN